MADAVSSPQSHAPPDNANPGKFLRHFLYKAVVITLFLVLLPIFPSIAPEFLNQTLHARSWELLHLIFVGIAVSYGLFSRKNDDTDKDSQYGSKLDNAQSYVSKLLQVSSVFDDESDAQTVVDDGKVQTWSSRYHRGEPVVVVAAPTATAGGKETPVGEENGAVSDLSRKPLLLPVRSLKQQDESGPIVRAGSRRSVKNLRRMRSEEVVDHDSVGAESEDNNLVLPSPIPWRSRSGRMEVKENTSPAEFVVSPSMAEQELGKIESRLIKPSKPDFAYKNSSPLSSKSNNRKKSITLEAQAESGEDVVGKTRYSSPPPAPPPPPPPPPPTSHYVRRSVLTKSNSGVMADAALPKRTLRRSVRSSPTEEMEEEPIRRVNPGAVTRARVPKDVSPLGRSVRTFRTNEIVMEADRKPKNELMEKVVVESSDDDDDDDSEYDNEVTAGVEVSSGNGEAATDDNSVNELGPDVDKKADEFIAKFREQIRLQRIESIRRSTVQRAGRTFR